MRKLPISSNVAALVQIPFQRRFPFLRARRVAAVDAGTSALKVVLVENSFGRIRVLRHECLDLREEGLLSPDDLGRQLQLILRDLDYDQIALVLPQHRSLSQVIDLPPEDDEQKFIQSEIVKLSGLSERALIYDYSKLEPFGKFSNPFWVSLCQEDEALAQIRRLAPPKEDLCEMTSGANALLAAFQSRCPDWSLPALLVDLGAASTTVALLVHGQGVQAGTFALGSDTFTEAIGRERDLPPEQAESIKRTQNLFTGRETHLHDAAITWLNELQRIVSDWTKDHPDIDARSVPLFLCGGGALQPGFLEFLNVRGPFNVRSWPHTGRSSSPQFAAAYGAAIHAVGEQKQAASLLPRDILEHSKNQQSLQRLQFANFLLILVLALFLVFGTWQKLSLLNAKNDLLAEANMALTHAKNADSIMSQLATQYEGLRPILERQRRTIDSLTALQSLQRAQTNQSFWYVLVSDQASYFAPLPAAIAPTNSVGTNSILELRPTPAAPNPRYGLIAEVAIPQTGDGMRATLSQLVTNLRQSPVFGNVDSLPSNRKRTWVDPKVTIPERTFALTLEFGENPYRRNLMWNTNQPAPALREKPPARTFKQRVDRPGGTAITEP